MNKQRPPEVVFPTLFGVFPIGTPVSKEYIETSFNKALEALGYEPYSRSRLHALIKILRDEKNAPIMSGRDEEDVQTVWDECRIKLQKNSYIRLNRDFILNIEMKPDEQQIFRQSIDTLLSLDFAGVNDLKNLLVKLKVLGSSYDERKFVSLDINYTKLKPGDGSFSNPMNHFDGLLSAIRNKKILFIKYRDFDNDNFPWFFQPMHIRESGDRWYLLAYHIDQTDLKEKPKLYTLGFERILDFYIAEDRRWIEQLTFNASDYFKDVIGVEKAWDTEPETIMLKVKKSAVPYWKTKIVHPSQEIGEPDEYGDVNITLSLIPNKALYETIYGQSKDIEVLKPSDLHARYLRGRNKG